MQFRLATILWVFALLASSMATFGAGGIFVGIIVIALWGYFYSETQLNPLGCLLTIGIIVVVLALMLPALQVARESARLLQCHGQLMQLSLGLLNYEDTNGHFPAAAQSDPNSEHLHSWRVWVSPYLESSNFYSQYRKEEFWDSETNRGLVASSGLVRWFQCPSHPVDTQCSHYFAIVGEHTAWPPDRGRRIGEFTDGTSNTILLIEAPHKNIPWAKPEDLSFDEAVQLLSNPPLDNDFGHVVDGGFFYKPSRGVNVAFADNHVEFLHLPIPRQCAVALLTVDGGEEFSDWDMRRLRNPKLDYPRIYGLCMFLLLSLAPVVKLRRRKRKSIAGES